MKTASQERAKMYPLSMRPAQKKAADARVRSLSPRVSSFSNYVQQLIELDSKKNLLGSFKFPPVLRLAAI